MFSNQKMEKMEDRPCDTLTAKEENSRVKQIQLKQDMHLTKAAIPYLKLNNTALETVYLRL